MKRAMALLLGVGLLLSVGCGGGGDDDAACGVADGDYTVAFGPGTGDCEDLDLTELSGQVGVVTIGPGAACDAVMVDVTDTGDGCETTIEIDAEVTADGVVDGHAVVQTDCPPEADACTQAFAVTFEPISSPAD